MNRYPIPCLVADLICSHQRVFLTKSGTWDVLLADGSSRPVLHQDGRKFFLIVGDIEATS